MSDCNARARADPHLNPMHRGAQMMLLITTALHSDIQTNLASYPHRRDEI